MPKKKEKTRARKEWIINPISETKYEEACVDTFFAFPSNRMVKRNKRSNPRSRILKKRLSIVKEKITKKEFIKNPAVIEGIDLGIFIYFSGFLIIGILYAFTSSPELEELIGFYLPFDIMAMGFSAFHFGVLHGKYKHPDYEFLNFQALNKKKVGIAFLFILIFSGLLGFSNFIFSKIPSFGQLDFIHEYTWSSYLVLQVGRTILIEELVFRGLSLVCVYFFLKLMTKRLKEPYNNRIPLIMAILVSGISFGFIHIFHYVDFLFPVISLSLLGILSAILAVKFGIWAGMILHIINNVLAAINLDRTMFSGNFSLYSGLFNWIVLEMMIVFIFVIVILFLLIRWKKSGLIVFPYLTLGLMIFFTIGYYTNGFLSLGTFLYFEHYHFILLIPGIYIYFKDKINHKKLCSFLVGCCLGLLISDYRDFLSLTSVHFTWTILYSVIALFIYSLVIYISKNNKTHVFHPLNHEDSKTIQKNK